MNFIVDIITVHKY